MIGSTISHYRIDEKLGEKLRSSALRSRRFRIMAVSRGGRRANALC